jgi:hypothetical protein
MKISSGEYCREIQNMFYAQYFFCRVLHLFGDYVEPYGEAGRAIDDNLAHAHRIATNTHSEYVTITAFQQRLC